MAISKIIEELEEDVRRFEKSEKYYHEQSAHALAQANKYAQRAAETRADIEQLRTLVK